MGLITLSDIKLPVEKDEKELIRLAEKRLGGKAGYFAIKKKSLDARDKENLRFVYTIEFSKESKKQEVRQFVKLPDSRMPKEKVLVVGSGPAGLFAAIRLLLARRENILYHQVCRILYLKAFLQTQNMRRYSTVLSFTALKNATVS